MFQRAIESRLRATGGPAYPIGRCAGRGLGEGAGGRIAAGSDSDATRPSRGKSTQIASRSPEGASLLRNQGYPGTPRQELPALRMGLTEKCGRVPHHRVSPDGLVVTWATDVKNVNNLAPRFEVPIPAWGHRRQAPVASMRNSSDE